MKSRTTTVDGYLNSMEPPWREILVPLRAACQEHLVGYDESISHGMPTYSRGDRPEVAFASQARYLSPYIMKTDVLDAHREELAELSVGKGCIRYVRSDQIDWGLVVRLLEDTADSDELPC
jgi:uncharacterized protein YdhG (YjbR/CyaY superfamily)